MLVEICASTYQSAINAQNGGAHRIELCKDLSVGGVTPNRDLIHQVVNDIKIPVHVLIRPRKGNFVYSEKEFEQMLLDIEYCKSIGCHGIVSGILNPDNTIDIERTRQLIETSMPKSFTFHRAFDDTPDSIKSLHILIELGIERILTSGHEPTAIQGLKTLKNLHKRANGEVTILVGGGIRAYNVSQFTKAGFNEVHSSAIGNSEDHSNLEQIQNLIRVANGF